MFLYLYMLTMLNVFVSWELSKQENWEIQHHQRIIQFIYVHQMFGKKKKNTFKCCFISLKHNKRKLTLVWLAFSLTWTLLPLMNSCSMIDVTVDNNWSNTFKMTRLSL